MAFTPSFREVEPPPIVNVTNSTISNYGKNGIVGNNNGLNCQVTNNMVTGRGPIDVAQRHPDSATKPSA